MLLDAEAREGLTYSRQTLLVRTDMGWSIERPRSTCQKEPTMDKPVMPSRGVQRIIKFIMNIGEIIALTCLMWKDEKDFMIEELEALKIRAEPHTIVLLDEIQVWVELEYQDSIGEREDKIPDEGLEDPRPGDST